MRSQLMRLRKLIFKMIMQANYSAAQHTHKMYKKNSRKTRGKKESGWRSEWQQNESNLKLQLFVIQSEYFEIKTN